MATSGKQQPIHWVRYRVQNVRNAQQLKMLNLPSPAAAPPPKVKERVVVLDDPVDLHAGTPKGEEIVLDLPDQQTLPPVRDTAVLLLQAAAKIEHGLLVQYLYAAYSRTDYKLKGQRDPISGIAIEEMSHLMTVQNLLLLLGQPPHLDRQDFGLPDADEERLFPFPLMLEPLNKQSLAKYILAEAPESADAQEPEAMGHVRAAVGQGQIINRVGLLYGFLGVVFGDQKTLMERAAEGDEWYQMVHRLAAILARIYGGRDRVHLPDSAFPDPNPHAARQGTDVEWDRSILLPSGLDDFRVFPQSAAQPLVRRGDALTALRDIGIQGEGSSLTSSSNPEASHFRRFLDEFKKLFPPNGAGMDAPQMRPVPAGTVIQIGGTGPNAITHPDSMKWATLGNLRYALLLGFLREYLLSPPADRSHLVAWVFAEMFQLKWLGNHLATSPRAAGGNPATAAAALPFSMPAEIPPDAAPADRWKAYAQLLQQAMTLAAELLPHQGGNTDPWLILNHLLASDRRKLDEAEARQQGKSVRTRYHKVSEILDWAAGAGFPTHNGTSPLTGAGNVPQRRFWNLSLDHFKQVAVFGQGILDPVDGEGSDSVLVDILKSGDMPQLRPPLPAAGPDIAFIDAWIRAGCPDDPLSPPPNPNP